MFNKELMLELKGRLEPARQEFARREREWAHKLIHTQIPDDTSLFWLLPSQLVKNLQNVLGPSSEDRIQFFLEYQDQREQNRVAGRVVQISAEPIIKRCLSPDETDIREHGFIRFPYFRPKLRRNPLWSAVKKHVAPVFGRHAERDDGEWIFRIEYQRWQVLTILVPNKSPWQFELEHEIRIGMGPLVQIPAYVSWIFPCSQYDFSVVALGKFSECAVLCNGKFRQFFLDGRRFPGHELCGEFVALLTCRFQTHLWIAAEYNLFLPPSESVSIEPGPLSAW